MSNLRDETEKAAEARKHLKHDVIPLDEAMKNEYLSGAFNGPPLLRALEALKYYAQRTETIFRPCDGSHSYYSTMANDDICPKCGNSEDGLGRELPHQVLRQDGETARKALLEIEAARGSGEK